ncbi:response regulator transcription factor [Bacillus benzoevorans]
MHMIQDELRKLESLSNQKEKIYQMLKVYRELFPVGDAFLFRYSPLEHLGEGIIALSDSGFTNIREIRDDIETLPLIYSAIRNRRAQYSSGMEYFLNHSSIRYTSQFPIDSLLITPICTGSYCIGYICSTQFPLDMEIDESVLSAITLYGRQAGRLFQEHGMEEDNGLLLSNRELEVMRRIARGESTKEMAGNMKISEVTVKQYVKSAMKKLGALNRAHAVAIILQKNT